MKIYTKVGDKGYTKQVTGKMVPKFDLQIEALGAIDELDSWLGFCRANLSKNTQLLEEELVGIQRILYLVQADIVVKSHNEVTLNMTTEMEKRIDQLSSLMTPLNEFIIPGGKNTGASLQVARTKARRAERTVVNLSINQETVSDQILQFLNRLSDYLFELALYANQLEDYVEMKAKK